MRGGRKGAVRIEHTNHGRETMQIRRGRGRAAVWRKMVKAGQDGEKVGRKRRRPRVGVGVGGEGGASPGERGGAF